MSESTGQLDQRNQPWRSKITSTANLIFTRTVSDVEIVTGNALTSATDLSEVIGHDMSIATRLLRIASSALFNRHGRTVDTINTAIVRIGFDAIRELAVSLALIEQVLKGRMHQRVGQTMARAFHAAVQAKALAALNHEKRLEEVFAATLLVELGAMLLWSQCPDEVDEIEELMLSGMPEEQAQRHVLGCTARELTAELAEDWHLGRLLHEVMSDPHGQKHRQKHPKKQGQVQYVTLGYEIATTVEAHGWKSSATLKLLGRIAKEYELSESTLKQLVEDNVQAAVDIAGRYGVTTLESMPITSNDQNDSSEQSQEHRAASQIEILQEIGNALADGRSLNELVALVLKGVHDGLGFDRTYFALLSKDREQLQCRYGLGNNPKDFINTTRRFQENDDLLRNLLRAGKPLLLTPESTATDPVYAQWLSYSTCALMPIVVQGKPVGLLYADRAVSQTSVDQQAFRGFQLFGQQLVAVLISFRDQSRAG